MVGHVLINPMKEDKGHQERPISRVANQQYRDNWQTIFGSKDEEPMRQGLKIILYTNVETNNSPNFEDEVQARIEAAFEHNNNVEIENVEFQYVEE